MSLHHVGGVVRIPSGTIDQFVYFKAVDATDRVTPETGLSSFTVYRSRNGGAAAAMTTPTINETDTTNMPGIYELLLDEDMTIDAGDQSQAMVFHVTHASMAPVEIAIELYRPDENEAHQSKAPYVVAHGTQTAILATEHTLKQITEPGNYQLFVDAADLAADEQLELRIYGKARGGDSESVAYYGKFNDAQALDLKIGEIVPSPHHFRATLEQTGGTGRAYSWSICDTSERDVPSLFYLFEGANNLSDAEIIGPAITFTRASSGTYFDSSGVMQTALSDVARLDHDSGNSNVPLGLLVESASTNICLQSEDLGTTWTNPGGNTTITTNAGSAPDGNTTADDVLHGDTAETVQQTITVTDNTVHTISAFVKQGSTGSHDFVKIAWLDESAGANGFEAWFNINTGVVGTAQANGTGSYTSGTAQIRDMGNGWYRISAAGQIPSGQTDARFEIINTTADAVDTAEATNSVFWWGLQAEEARFPSSYISTTGSSATRAVDVVNVADVHWFNESQGTFIVNQSMPYHTNATRYILSMNDNSFNNRHEMHQDSTPNLKMDLVNGGSFEVSSTVSTVDNTDGMENKNAYSYLENDFSIVSNGGTVSTDTDASLPHDITIMDIGQRLDQATPLDGHIRLIRYFDRRKPDSYIKTATT